MNLALTLRPQNLSEFVGQEQLIGKGKIIQRMIEQDQLFSMILWGPPGSGKTTLAQIIAKETDAAFYELSGVSSGKEDLRKVINTARENLQFKKRTVLFIDEVHRWNKAQQDALLPHVESGLIILIGATTENPSFEVISALLSRSRVFVLESLSTENLKTLIDKALTDPTRGLGKYKKKISEENKELLTRLSGGDARIMLNALEIAVTNYPSKSHSTVSSDRIGSGQVQKEISEKIIQDVFQTKSAGLYDKKADEHYNIISAFIKSMRGSDPNATLYYLMRMLENGEDPKFIARRMIIFASEDIGLADRGALIQANAGFEAVHKIGMPEAQLILSHIALYLATAKKSRAVTNAMSKAKQAVYELPNEPIPLHLRNAPTKLMKKLGYGQEYTNQSFLPKNLKNKTFYIDKKT